MRKRHQTPRVTPARTMWSSSADCSSTGQRRLRAKCWRGSSSAGVWLISKKSLPRLSTVSWVAACSAVISSPCYQRASDLLDDRSPTLPASGLDLEPGHLSGHGGKPEGVIGLGHHGDQGLFALLETCIKLFFGESGRGDAIVLGLRLELAPCQDITGHFLQAVLHLPGVHDTVLVPCLSLDVHDFRH